LTIFKGKRFPTGQDLKSCAGGREAARDAFSGEKGGREQASQIKRLLAGLNAKNLYVSVVPKAGFVI
jgi:hypothetical protein